MARSLSRRAYSLFEVMLALGLLSFAVLTMVGVYASGFKLLAQGREHTAAIDVARSELMALQEVQFSSLPSSAATFDGRPASAVPKAFPPAPWPRTVVNGRTFSMVVEVRPRAATLKELTVKVYWGTSGPVTLQTLAAP